MADDYTPTTEQVRDGYRFDPEAEYHNPTVNWAEHNGRAFDRWLAKHDAEVGERIAAAIEAESAYRNGRDRAQWGDLERIVDTTFATAARIARTPDPNGDNT